MKAINIESIVVVRVEGDTLEQLVAGVGFIQVSYLRPLLFIMVMKLISAKVSIQNELKKIMYADDVAAVEDSKEEVQNTRME